MECARHQCLFLNSAWIGGLEASWRCCVDRATMALLNLYLVYLRLALNTELFLCMRQGSHLHSVALLFKNVFVLGVSGERGCVWGKELGYREICLSRVRPQRSRRSEGRTLRAT